MNTKKFCATNWLYNVGLRPTKQRVLLANLLMGDGRHQHFTAEDLFEKFGLTADAIVPQIMNKLNA
mgnify:CR=1 FL=1